MGMSREKAIDLLDNLIGMVEDNQNSDYDTAFKMAIKALEQESILDKIYADIQKLRGCSCSCSDGIIDDVEDILDKYKAETEG